MKKLLTAASVFLVTLIGNSPDLSAQEVEFPGVQDEAQIATLKTKFQNSGEKPNILVIWGNDIGWSNLGCYNHAVMGYGTPNIDRIAKAGVMFTDHYAQPSPI